MVKTGMIAVLVVGLAPVASWAEDGFQLGNIQLQPSRQVSIDPRTASHSWALADDQSQSSSSSQPANQGNTNTGNGNTSNVMNDPWMQPGTTSGYRNESTEIWGPQQGDWEFTLSGTGSNDRRFNSGAYGVTGGIAYYLTRNIEMGVRQSFQFEDSQNSSGWMGVTRGALDFNLPFGRFVPFIGVNGGASYGEHQSWEPVLAPEVGLKFYLYPKTFVYGLAEYDWFVDHAFGEGAFGYTVGLGINF